MNKKILWSIIIISGLLIVVPIAWYLLSPLFIDNVVSEDLPANSGNTENSQGTLSESQIELYSGSFVDADAFHKTFGTAKVLEIDGDRYLRFENFEATNGPDLKVYLSTDKGATDYVSLGDLKGNIGDQNYILPSNLDLEENSNVLIWCERFSVLFGSAKLD